MTASPYPEQVPATAVRPVLSDGRCIACCALPRVVVWKVMTTPGAASVIEAQMCARHATRAEVILEETGWCIVLDRRQALTDEESGPYA